ITDVNHDGFIDVNDAAILYPQGHGDAWGHYLTALTMHYDLLRNPNFNWVSRSEFVNVNNVVLPVDYLDERTFAQAAGAKAQAGADIVNLVYRSKYVADPSGQWQGYTDTDTNRAWGVEEWARRAGQGAYFDWITANALLPAVDPNISHSGIQKVDRTTVPDLANISAGLWSVQTTLEQVNKGNNPLGVANGALTFDISPAALNVAPGTANFPVQGQTLFDQVYQRAVSALNNALVTFNNANQINNMIRQVAKAYQNFLEQFYQQHLSYRNQEIEIFGTPYPGAIGSCQAYPPGYQGPDTMLYMYVDVNNLNDNTVPQPPASYYSAYQGLISSNFFNNPLQPLLNALGAGPGPSSTTVGTYQNYSNSYNLTFANVANITNTVNYTDFTDTNNSPLTDGVNELVNLNLPIMASGYTFVAPSGWGERATPGQLQIQITQMLQAQADLNNALYEWDNTQGTFLQKLQLISTKYQFDVNIDNILQNKINLDAGTGAAALALRTVASIADIVTKDAADDVAKAAKEAIPTSTPIVGLADGLGDALSAVRAAILFTADGVSLPAQLVIQGLNSAADTLDLAKDIQGEIYDLQQN